ncbi:hypothetical protein [Streptomyces sp. NRRL F-5135]|uniref:hypothetical protein n=1 Tax=Streptomyces sp. NRRL F-5135 TaxID=1463858 RepID=UPI0004C74BF1|nr:hypothetical protein [Streptomyces sp. NRRL F-5135]
MSSSSRPTGNSAGSTATDARETPGLESGLAIYTSLQAATQFADTKVAVLGAVQAGLMATALPQGEAVREAWERGGPGAWVAVCVLVLRVTAFLPAVYCVVQALRPRLGPPPAPNRFSLPLLAIADGTPPPPGQDLERQEIWQLIPVLAKVAVTKHRYITRGVAWTGLMAVAAGLSLLTGPLLP